jgi:translation initiation factor 2 subunit 1
MAEENEEVIRVTMEKKDEKDCRMYEAKYPEVDDLVIVQVKMVAEMGAYVELLEYNNIEGMILLSELSRRRIRSINKLIRVGRREIVVVLRVDKEKGYIDLSKRRVSPEEMAKCEARYNKSKAVHSILRHVAEINKVPQISLYEKFGWDLYKKFGHAHNAFKLIVGESDKVLDAYDIDPAIKESLVKDIQRRMTPQAIKLRADLEVTCFAEAGIDAIKEALAAGEACSTDDIKISIKLVAPPLYVMMTTHDEKEIGIAALEKACEQIQTTIIAKGGDLTIKTAARAVSERDDKILSSLMETLEKQNQEVPDDDPEEDE